MKIKSEVLTRIKEDKDLREKLAAKMGRTVHTVYLWMWGNSDNLTKYEALQVISDHTGLTVENLLES